MRRSNKIKTTVDIYYFLETSEGEKEYTIKCKVYPGTPGRLYPAEQAQPPEPTEVEVLECTHGNKSYTCEQFEGLVKKEENKPLDWSLNLWAREIALETISDVFDG
jgi:hypothetical protein